MSWGKNKQLLDKLGVYLDVRETDAKTQNV